MRVVLPPGQPTEETRDIDAITARLTEVLADNERLRSASVKTPVKQVIVDRVVDNPILLEKIETQRKQIEALEKARLSVVASVKSPSKPVVEVKTIETVVDRVVEVIPKWMLLACLGGGSALLALGYALGKL